MQRCKDAIESYSKVAQIESVNEFDWFMKGFALCKLERYEEAFDCCEKALQSYPNCPYALYCKVCCYIRQNNIVLALETLGQVMQLSPRQVKWYIRSERIFDPLRENPLFQQILEM